MPRYFSVIVYLITLGMMFGINNTTEATVINGSYEDLVVLNGWTATSRNVGVTTVGVTGDESGVDPTDGISQAVLHTGAFGISRGELTTFLGFNTAPDLDAALGGTRTQWAAAIKQEITVGVGDVLSWDWNLISSINQSGLGFYAFVDQSVVMASNATPNKATSFEANNSNTQTADPSFIFQAFGDTLHTGYQTDSHLFADAGTFTVSFVLIHASAVDAYSSALLVDNVTLSSQSTQGPPLTQPEPGTLILFGLGLLGLMIVGWHRRERAT